MFAEDARRRLSTAVVTWNQVLLPTGRAKSPEAPDRVGNLAEMLPVQPSVVSYTIAIQACLRRRPGPCGRFDRSHDLLGYLPDDANVQ
jgi:hypothetical protein